MPQPKGLPWDMFWLFSPTGAARAARAVPLLPDLGGFSCSQGRRSPGMAAPFRLGYICTVRGRRRAENGAMERHGRWRHPLQLKLRSA